MKKPNWWWLISKSYKFSWKPSYYLCKYFIWKDKYNSPRVELLPKLWISWLWWELTICHGNERDWEWYLWVEHYNNGSKEKAIENWGWYKFTGEKLEQRIKTTPWLEYNK